jgi:hypothetical protein
VLQRGNALEPRSKFSQMGSNAATVGADEPTGSLVYVDTSGNFSPVVASATTFAYFDGTSWVQLTYSGTSEPGGGTNDLVFGTSVYLPRADANIMLFANGINEIFSWAGPSSGTLLSTLTGAPVARDVTLFDNRPVAWNILDPSTSTRYVQRVQWSVRGDPEDWTSQFAGTDDLLDMRGEGTRIFTLEDALLLMSSEEIWIGRKIGVPFVFQFEPLDRDRGAPYPRAAAQLEDSVVFLGRDLMVYRVAGAQAQPISQPIHRRLVQDIQDPDRAFFQYDPGTRNLYFWYSRAADSAATQAWAYHLDSQQWTPHTTAHGVAFPLLGAPLQATSSASTWGGLAGTLDAQSQTYDAMAGLQAGTRASGVVSSVGTAYRALEGETSDDGSTVAAEAVIGPYFAAASNLRWYGSEVRFEARSFGASTMSVAIGDGLGRSFPQEQTVSLVAGSETTQYRANFGVPGTAFSVRLRDESGNSWRGAALGLRARPLGEYL